MRQYLADEVRCRGGEGRAGGASWPRGRLLRLPGNGAAGPGLHREQGVVRLLPLAGQHQVIDMDEGGATSKPEDRLELIRLLADQLGGVFRGVGRDAAGDGLAFRIDHVDRVTTLEAPR